MLKLHKTPSCSDVINISRLMVKQPNKNPENKSGKLRINKLSQEFNDQVALTQDDGTATAVNTSVTTSATILIVDDTPNNLQVLFSYLETAGFRVLLAEDGESAIQIAQSQDPDLILLDVLMPQVDGFETCSRLKAQLSTREIPVIFLTALSETVNKVQGFKLGGVDYITKPTEQEEVLARIQTHLNLQRMRRTLENQNQDLQRALNFEALVKRITDKIRDRLDQSCLQVAVKELATVLNLGSCQIEQYDSQQEIASITQEYTISLPQCLGNSRRIIDFSELYSQLLQKITVQIVEDISSSQIKKNQSNRLACPIFDSSGIIGNLWANKPEGEKFSPVEIRVMEQVAVQCAIAIRQARLYESSNNQVTELANLNQLKDDFLKTISHELKAPMSSIQLGAQTLETLLSNKKNLGKSKLFERVLNIFRNSCQRQQELVDDLLTICYVDAQNKVLQPEWINLNFWLPDLTQLYLERANNQQQKLILDLAGSELNVFVDPAILERIVRELLNNACKYTPNEGIIKIQTQVSQSSISLCITNTGSEISVKEQELIFDQFYRSPNNDNWQYGGTGLGLTLVKKLANMLDIDVEVNSNSQETSFCLKLAQPSKQ